jgi:signal peptidase I
MLHPLLLWFYLFADSVLVLVLLGIGARLACRVVIVRGISMLPTLADGDRLIVLNWWPRRLLRKGQLVLSHSSLVATPGSSMQVKRIVATAGDIVKTSLDEIESLHMQSSFARYHDENGLRTWHIPPRYVFLRGDNRGKSADSLIAGPFPYEEIRGVVLMKLPHTFLLFSRREESASTS